LFHYFVSYGLMTALQNLGLSVAPLGVSLLIPDHPQQVAGMLQMLQLN
jgi:hypothetical protein